MVGRSGFTSNNRHCSSRHHDGSRMHGCSHTQSSWRDSGYTYEHSTVKPPSHEDYPCTTKSAHLAPLCTPIHCPPSQFPRPPARPGPPLLPRGKGASTTLPRAAGAAAGCGEKYNSPRDARDKKCEPHPRLLLKYRRGPQPQHHQRPHQPQHHPHTAGTAAAATCSCGISGRRFSKHPPGD
jgi:hypothetical protein